MTNQEAHEAWVALEGWSGKIARGCPNCGTASFESRRDGREHGNVIRHFDHGIAGLHATQVVYQVLQCAGCDQGALIELHVVYRAPFQKPGATNESWKHVAGNFYPSTVSPALLPPGIPDGVSAEFREAERCMAAGAFRAASAMFRSVLEKTLRANGYKKKNENLASMIDLAAADGIIHETRKKRAHNNVRVLGNDVVHDHWKPVSEKDVEEARRYCQRILEDFYEDRATVEETLQQKHRTPDPNSI